MPNRSLTRHVDATPPSSKSTPNKPTTSLPQWDQFEANEKIVEHAITPDESFNATKIDYFRISR